MYSVLSLILVIWSFFTGIVWFAAGSEFLLALNFLLAFFGALYILRKKTGLDFSYPMLFLAAYFLLFFTYPLLTYVGMMEPWGSKDVRVIYLFLLNEGLCLFVLGYLVGGNLISRSWEARSFQMRLSRINFLIAVGVAISLAGLALIVLDIGPSRAISATRSLQKLETTPIFLVGMYMLFVSYPIWALLPLLKKRAMFLWMLILVPMDIFIFLVLKIRTPVIGHLFAFVTMLAFREKFSLRMLSSRLRLNQKLRRVFLVGTLVLLVVLGISLRVIRGYLELYQRIDFSEVKQMILDGIVFSFQYGDFGYAPIVYQVIEQCNNTGFRLWGQSYYRIFFIWIPRAIWKSKPENTQRVVAKLLNPAGYELGLTIPPGVVGDAYLNFGLYGIFVLFFIGVIFATVKFRNGFHYALFSSLSLPWVFHLARGGFTNPLVIGVVMYLLSFGTAKFICSRISGEEI